MVAVGKRCVDKSEDGLKELLAFIKSSLSGDGNSTRKLVADKDYFFIIYTQLPDRTQDCRKVKVDKGMSLLLFTQTSPKGPTNANIFLVDDEDGAWRVDVESGAVRRFARNIHVSAPIVDNDSTVKIKGLGLRHY
ncbi:MAG: hypothetical protein JWO55_401 [Candidatus Saccharibacteria bacterium]|jgi:hypothetical protein|nr:hypothetical protein [Candidatus Saccharibacteria bacterium]